MRRWCSRSGGQCGQEVQRPRDVRQGADVAAAVDSVRIVQGASIPQGEYRGPVLEERVRNCTPEWAAAITGLPAAEYTFAAVRSDYEFLTRGFTNPVAIDGAGQPPGIAREALGIGRVGGVFGIEQRGRRRGGGG